MSIHQRRKKSEWRSDKLRAGKQRVRTTYQLKH
ncbi:unnamed protein product [Schistosoma margrebowiei]|uniref:Uncharacterized protein n=1 Tax=Schistosoma margrebowiei TaxID=48269 RepID=A0A183MH73_9TREM|nr:unnamed protein product [Schistosoma margrebowiei]